MSPAARAPALASGGRCSDHNDEQLVYDAFVLLARASPNTEVIFADPVNEFVEVAGIRLQVDDIILQFRFDNG